MMFEGALWFADKAGYSRNSQEIVGRLFLLIFLLIFFSSFQRFFFSGQTKQITARRGHGTRRSGLLAILNP
jgi:hypothetical protein